MCFYKWQKEDEYLRKTMTKSIDNIENAIFVFVQTNHIKYLSSLKSVNYYFEKRNAKEQGHKYLIRIIIYRQELFHTY